MTFSEKEVPILWKTTNRKNNFNFQYFNISFNCIFDDIYSNLEPFEYNYILSFNSIDHWKWEQVETGIETQNMKVRFRKVRTEKILEYIQRDGLLHFLNFRHWK